MLEAQTNDWPLYFHVFTGVLPYTKHVWFGGKIIFTIKRFCQL